jgi:Leucine-rich repeat (LRR) protein
MASADDGIDYVSRLPAELLLHICSYLDNEHDVQHFANTCTSLRATITSMYESNKITDKFNIQHWPLIRHKRCILDLLNHNMASCQRIQSITDSKRSCRDNGGNVKRMNFVTSTKHHHYPVRIVGHDESLLYLFNTTLFTNLQHLSITDADIYGTTGLETLTKLRSLTLIGVTLQEDLPVLPKGCDVYMKDTYTSLEFAMHASCVQLTRTTTDSTDLSFLRHVSEIHLRYDHRLTLSDLEDVQILTVTKNNGLVIVPPLEQLEQLTLECHGSQLPENLPRLQFLEILHSYITDIPMYPRLSTLRVEYGRTLRSIIPSPSLAIVELRHCSAFVNVSCLSGVADVKLYQCSMISLENTHGIKYLNMSESNSVYARRMPQSLRHSLLELNVSHTHVEEINHYTHLKKLDITGNQVVYSLIGLDALEELVAVYTKLKDVSHLKKLRKLDISNTYHYTDTRGLEHLEELIANESRIVSVATLGSLKLLDIRHSCVTDITPVLGVPDLQISACMHPSGDAHQTNGIVTPCKCRD